MSIFSKLAKWSLSKVGVGVYRLPSKDAAQDSVEYPRYDPIEHNTVKRINEFYRNPEFRSIQMNPHRFDLYEEIASFAETAHVEHDGKDVADVGCGTGHFLQHLHDRFQPESLHGFDVSEGALEVARDVLPDASFDVLDIYQDNGQRFDVVYCIEVLEHLLHPKQALATLVSMTRPGGVLVLTVPDGRIDQYHGHINFWSPESWKIFLESAGEDWEMETGICTSMSRPINIGVLRRVGVPSLEKAGAGSSEA